MPILKAVGLGVAIIVLKVLTPEIFDSLEGILLVLLQVLEANLHLAEAAVGSL